MYLIFYVHSITLSVLRVLTSLQYCYLLTFNCICIERTLIIVVISKTAVFTNNNNLIITTEQYRNQIS